MAQRATPCYGHSSWEQADTYASFFKKVSHAKSNKDKLVCHRDNTVVWACLFQTKDMFGMLSKGA